MSDPTTDIATTVDPRTAELYLLAEGWEARRRTPNFSTWSRPDLTDVALFLPLSSVPDDYAERLAQFVERLAALEEAAVSTVVTNLRYAASDLVRVRLVSPRVGAGELPITDGAKLFDGARDLMIAAACAAVEPRPAYGSKKHGSVVDYLDGVRLGQTERGSYVVTIISDVRPDEQMPLVPDQAAHVDVPFERRVTTQLMTALDAVTDAAHRVIGGAKLDVFEEAIDAGVSANLCDALETMGKESQASTVEVSVNWAVSRLPTVKLQTVSVEPTVLQVLPDASRALKQLGPFENVEVVGIVGVLDRGANDEIGTIVIEGVAKGDRRNVRVELIDAQYHRAVEAHDAKLTVAISGTLVKDGKHWTLLDPGPIRIGV